MMTDVGHDDDGGRAGRAPTQTHTQRNTHTPHLEVLDLALDAQVHALQRLFAGQGVGGPLEAALPPWLAQGIWGPGGALPALRTLGMGLASASGAAEAFAALAGAPGGAAPVKR